MFRNCFWYIEQKEICIFLIVGCIFLQVTWSMTARFTLTEVETATVVEQQADSKGPRRKESEVGVGTSPEIADTR